MTPFEPGRQMIPNVADVRAQLHQAAADVRLLKQLLRLAEAKDRERERILVRSSGRP